MFPKIAIIIPCYEEANRLQKDKYLLFSRQNPNVFFLFVNDGSKDKTLIVLKDLKEKKSENIDVLNLKNNLGKAEAVRNGINHVLKTKDVQYVGFLDADLSTPLTELESLLGFIISHNEIKMISGSRIRKMGAHIERLWIRHYIGRIIATVAGSVILKLPVYDTQCGAKVFDSKLAGDIFRERFVTRWLFDIEIYCRIINNFGRKEALRIIYELPLKTWCDIRNSKVTLKDLFSVPFELLRIHSRYFI